MPHILLENFPKITTPNAIDGVEFDFIAKKINLNNSHKDEYKVLTKNNNKEFLLTLKPKDENYLVKADKVTRVSPVETVKNAINSYVKLSNEKILFSNTNNLVQKSLSPISEYHKDIEFFINDFKTDKKVSIEIGFGSGRHLLYQAKNNPDTIYIGLEIHSPSLEQVLKQIEIQDIKNIYVLNYDARIFLEFIESNTISQIFVHFPVPWDKKPHRRVYSNEFVNEALRVLKVDGTLELRTDSRKYFDYCVELLTNLPSGRITIDINKDLGVSSKYEDRWKAQGKNIYDVVLTNYILDEKLNFGDKFEFNKKFYLETILKKIFFKPLVEKDFFIHFEDIYTSNDEALIKTTFGNFNRPESKYLLLKNNHLKYFQGNPVASKANIKAHQKISELLANG